MAEVGDETRHLQPTLGPDDVTAAVAPIVQPPPSIWLRLGASFGLVALRPRLFADCDVRKDGDEHVLVRATTGATVVLEPRDRRFIAQFDGTRSIAEMIVLDLGAERRLDIDPVLHLVDRVVRAGMIENFPPNMFRQLIRHLTARAVEHARLRGASIPDVSPDAPSPSSDGSGLVSQHEQVPWRPRTPMVAERAQFLRSVEELSELDLWAIGALAEAAKEETFPAASNVVTGGAENGDRFYVVRSGEVNILHRDEDSGGWKRIARLEVGGCFGEFGPMDTDGRAATVRVGPSRPVQTLSFDKATFDRIIAPRINGYRDRRTLNERHAALADISLFSAFRDDDLDRLVRVMREREVPRGTVLCREGDVGDAFWVLRTGLVGVFKGDRPVARLGPGDFFGETALLFTSRRTATVITMEDSQLWYLNAAAFQRLVREHLLGRRELMPTLMNRL